MERYVGLDGHARSCTLGVMTASGQRLKSMVVETNGRALVEAVRSIPGRVHLCLEEGTRSAWLYELLKPHVAEVVVAMAPQSKGAKDDERDAWARADELRVGSIETRVYKAPQHLASLRNAVRAYGFAVTDVVRAKNRLKAVFLSRGVCADTAVYNRERRLEWLKQLPASHRQLAEWLGRQLDQAEPLRDEAERWLALEAKAHPIIRKLATAPGMGPIRTAQLVAIVATPERFRTRRQFWSYCGLGIVTRSSSDWAQDKSGKWVRPPLARLTVARKIAAMVLSMWKHQEVYNPKRTQPFARTAVGALDEAEETGCRSGVAARERFEGEHPLVSFSPGRDGKTRDEGYAPSECRLKPWPFKALSGAWRPRFAGGRNDGFEIEGIGTGSQAVHFVGLTHIAALARSDASTTSALVFASNRPLQELARTKGRSILLTTHFSGAHRSCHRTTRLPLPPARPA